MIDEEHQEEGTPTDEISSGGAGETPQVPLGGAAGAGSDDNLPGIDGQSDTLPSADADYSAKVAELEQQLQNLKKAAEEEKNQLTNLLARSQADFDNFRKRTARDKEEWEQKAIAATVNILLPVVDNFERARSQLKPQTDQETTIHKSYQSVYKQLVDCLKQIGVAPMRAEGKEFDPNLHEAVMREATSQHPEGTVMEELQRGYMLGDRVLRHALVKVAAPPEPGMESETPDQETSDG